MTGRSIRAGLTLAEMMVVVFTLSILTVVAVPLIRENSAQTQADVTEVNMSRLADVITNRYKPTAKEKSDKLLHPQLPGRKDHPQVCFLFVNPETGNTLSTYNPTYKLGWNGPYLARGRDTYKLSQTAGFTDDFGLPGDPAVLDGWGNPIVLTEVNVGGEVWLHLNSAGADLSLNQLPNIVRPICRIFP